MPDSFDFEPDPQDRKREKLMILAIGVFSGIFYYALFRVAMSLFGMF